MGGNGCAIVCRRILIIKTFFLCGVGDFHRGEQSRDLEIEKKNLIFTGFFFFLKWTLKNMKIYCNKSLLCTTE